MISAPLSQEWTDLLGWGSEISSKCGGSNGDEETPLRMFSVNPSIWLPCGGDGNLFRWCLVTLAGITGSLSMLA